MPLQSDKLRLLRRIPDIRFEEETRGYSKDQVDRVLANLAPLADEIERLQARLSESETRAASAEARLVEARSPSQASGAPGMPPAPQPDFDETLRNTLVSAQRQADTTIREAKEEAERLRTEAEFQSNALLADARDQASE
ncbi:MAG: DivIVA domain-containing protein, partial [Acidimicrobiales bacterium]